MAVRQFIGWFLTIKSIPLSVENYLRRNQKLETADPNELSTQVVEAFWQSTMNPGILKINQIQNKSYSKDNKDGRSNNRKVNGPGKRDNYRNQQNRSSRPTCIACYKEGGTPRSCRVAKHCCIHTTNNGTPFLYPFPRCHRNAPAARLPNEEKGHKDNHQSKGHN